MGFRVILSKSLCCIEIVALRPLFSRRYKTIRVAGFCLVGLRLMCCKLLCCGWLYVLQ